MGRNCLPPSTPPSLAYFQGGDSGVFLKLYTYLLSRYKLLRTQSLTSKQAFHLQNFEDDFDFWQPIKSGFSTDIMIGPNQYDFLSNQLKNQEINFDIVMDDIGSIIKSQRIEPQNRNLQQGKISFDTYYSHDEVSLLKIFKGFFNQTYDFILF